MSAASKIGVIDYGGGNIRSLVKALETLGTTPRLVTSPEELDDLSLVFFPGQGAFGDCMAKLQGLNLVDSLTEWIHSDRPFFGICIGYQLLFESSEENPGVEGLSIFSGQVTKFPESELKVPHMGWNRTQLRETDLAPWSNLGPAPYFYYVHSYFPVPHDPELAVAITDYGTPFASAIQRGRLVATQFHPEKSQKSGMLLIQNFLVENGAVSNP